MGFTNEVAVTTPDLFLSRMDKILVSRELVRIKRERFGDDDGTFVSKAKLHWSTLEVVEKGGIPTLPLLERWCVTCGMPLSDFIALIESLEHHGKKSAAKREPKLVSLARSLAQRGDPVAVNAFEALMERQLSA